MFSGRSDFFVVVECLEEKQCVEYKYLPVYAVLTYFFLTVLIINAQGAIQINKPYSFLFLVTN